MTHVVAVATGKGGVGKTSVTSALAGLFAADGYRVAIVEIDPQDDIADDLRLRRHPDHDSGHAVAAALLRGEPLGSGIEARPGLTYFPAGRAVEDLVDGDDAHDKPWRGLDSKLGDAVRKLEGYDFVFIDTPPFSRSLQQASLLAATHLLIPTASNVSSLMALRTISTRLFEVEEFNPDLVFLGVVLWNVSVAATRVRATTRQRIAEVFGKHIPLFDTTIRSANVAAHEVQEQGKLPHELAAELSKGKEFWQAIREGRAPKRVPASVQGLSDDYRALAAEVLRRLEMTS